VKTFLKTRGVHARVCALHTSKDDGMVTAELAIALPVLTVITFICLWLLSLAVVDFQLHGHAATVARLVARGDEVPSKEQLQLARGSIIDVSQDKNLVSVEISDERRLPIRGFDLFVTLKAHAVAANEGQ